MDVNLNLNILSQSTIINIWHHTCIYSDKGLNNKKQFRLTHNYLQIEVIMKNIISENDANPTREFAEQKGNSFAQKYNQYSKTEQKLIKKFPSKLIKGKVKVYNHNKITNHMNNENLSDVAELNLVSKRMLYFLKFTFLVFSLISLFFFLKKIINN